MFDSELDANEELNNDSSTYAGQTVMIKDESGKYIPWIVQKSLTQINSKLSPFLSLQPDLSGVNFNQNII